MNRNERAARAWAKRLLRNPGRYQAGFRRWIQGRPDRFALYTEIMDAIDAAGLAGRSIRLGHMQVEQPLRVKLSISPATRVLALAAGLAIVAGLLIAGTAMIPWLHENANPPTYLATTFGYQTRIGEVRTVTLPDGSKVTLDTDTGLALRFTDAERAIDLIHGRARFDVAHDPAHPFIVYAAGGSVTATGTMFDVTNIDGVTVNLLRGSINVAPPHRPETLAPPPLRLHPGQMVAFLSSGTSSASTPVEAKPSDAQWVTGMKTFDDVPVHDIIAEANTYSVDKIELAEPSLGATKVFIDLDIRDTAAVARKLATYLHLGIDRGTAGKLILRRDR